MFVSGITFSLVTPLDHNMIIKSGTGVTDRIRFFVIWKNKSFLENFLKSYDKNISQNFDHFLYKNRPFLNLNFESYKIRLKFRL